jgi:ssDNA-binding Zn-finger/Zn-ribbon topoisomerase 1
MTTAASADNHRNRHASRRSRMVEEGKSLGGRPPIAGVPASLKCSFRLTPAQDELLRTGAAENGFENPRDYILRMLVSDVGSSMPNKADLVAQVQSELKRQEATEKKAKCPECNKKTGAFEKMAKNRIYFRCEHKECGKSWFAEIKSVENKDE